MNLHFKHRGPKVIGQKNKTLMPQMAQMLDA